MSTLHLHHLENSRSFRIIWLLEELKLDYQLTTYERKHGLAPKAMQRIHPLGKSPILQDGDLALVESAHIIEHIIDHYDTRLQQGGQRHIPTVSDDAPNDDIMLAMVKDKQLRPDYGTAAYEQYRYWLHFTESSLMPLRMISLMFAFAAKKSPIGIKQVAQLLHRGVQKSYLNQSSEQHLQFLNQHLSKHTWLAGSQFSGADIHLEFVINAMAQTGDLPAKYTHIHNWLKKAHVRPAYQRAVEKGGVMTLNVLSRSD